MSSAQSKSPRSPKPSASLKSNADQQANPSPDSPLPAKPTDPMAQLSESALAATPPSSSTPPTEVMPSTPSESPSESSADPNAVDLSSAASSEAKPEAPAQSEDTAEAAAAVLRQQPIPPASEPMQYRAIGLVRGIYLPSAEQFTRGALQTDDGVLIEAVLLGRVMSLVKKHLDLSEPHLWVVYPRTREQGDSSLHLQIVGVWEPEKLNRSELDSEADIAEAAEVGEADTDEAEAASAAATPSPDKGLDAVPSTELDDRYFSIRGEIVFQSAENEQLMVKIRRAVTDPTGKAKPFKLALKGTLEGKAVGCFWDLNVRREADLLVVQDGTLIGVIPPQKRKKFGGRGGGGGRRPGGRGGPGGPARKRWNGPREGQRSDAPRGESRGEGQRPYRAERPLSDRPATTTHPRPSKPVKRRPPSESSES